MRVASLACVFLGLAVICATFVQGPPKNALVMGETAALVGMAFSVIVAGGVFALLSLGKDGEERRT